jgi:hypothetical protein
MIYQKIQEIRVKLIKMKLKKTGYNKFANFHYYQLEDFMPALTELMENNKITSNFSIIGENAILTLIDYEDNTSSIFQSPIADASIKGCTPVQSLGGVHTYLKRYLYQNAFEINDGDLLDASLGREEEDPLITPSTIKAILDLLKDLGKEEASYRDFIIKNYNKPLEKLTMDEGAKEAAYLAESLKKKKVIKPKEFDI